MIAVRPDCESFYFSCPFRGDLQNCAALHNSPVNFCPDNEEVSGVYKVKLPEGCPLKKGPIMVFLDKG